MDEATYEDRLDPTSASQSPDGAGGSKLPPVLANLMGSMGAGKNPQGPNPNSSINVQEILTSIMVIRAALAQSMTQQDSAPQLTWEERLYAPLAWDRASGPSAFHVLAPDPQFQLS